MRRRYRTTPGSTGFLTALSVATGLGIQGALTVSGPLLARMLGPVGRGHLAAITIWPAALTYLGSLGLPAAITYATARGAGDPRKLARSTIVWVVGQSVVLLVVQAAIFAGLLHSRASSVRIAGLAALALVPAMLAQQYGLGLLQGQQRFFLFNLGRIIPTASYATIVVALFVAHIHSLVAVVLAWVTANAVAGALTMGAGLLVPAAPPSMPEMTGRQIVDFGLRGLFVGNSPVEVVRLDQMVLAIFLTPAALGAYVVGISLTNLPTFVSKGVGMVAFPSVAAETDGDVRNDRMWHFARVNLWLSLVVVGALLASARWLIPLAFGHGFKSSVVLAYILLPGMVFLSVRRVLAEGLRGLGHPTVGTVSEIAALVWLAIALAAFVPLWGAKGAALGMTTSYVVGFVIVFTGALRHVPRSSGRRRVVTPAALRGADAR